MPNGTRWALFLANGEGQRTSPSRGPATILFISRDSCTDSIAKVFRVCFFMAYRATIARYVANCQDKASAEIRGEFFRTKSWANFAGDFFVDFSGLFSLEKAGGKNPPKNPRQNLNQNLGVLRPKSTLQGSGLDKLGLGCTPRGSCNRTLLKRVLRRFSNSKCFLEGFLEGACKGFGKDKVLRRVLRRESFIEGA